jgi:hypothetical protein
MAPRVPRAPRDWAVSAMIYEFRTYTFKPGTLAEMLRRWEPA